MNLSIHPGVVRCWLTMHTVVYIHYDIFIIMQYMYMYLLYFPPLRYCRENRLLEDDLTNMTSESQRLSNDIKQLIDERTQLSDQVQDYIAEVRRVEDVLAQKVS
mgnify:FL=1